MKKETERERKRQRQTETKTERQRQGKRERERRSMGRGRQRNVKSTLFIRTLISSWRLHLRTSFKLNYLPKTPPPNTVTLGIRDSTYEFEEATFSPQQ